MCGISGYFSKNGFLGRQDVEKMVSVLDHRGPDFNSIYINEIVGLGHNRLSILDLSSSGNQPMHSSNSRYAIVYNGEVYNFAQLGDEIKRKRSNNFSFVSRTDTEIILEGYAEFGLSFFDKMNGMFALAIYDKQKKEIVLARDRSGIKPLFYFWDGENFVFASELKALKLIGKLDFKINLNAIPHYLHLGFIPGPFSIYSNCYKLEPGSYLTVSFGGIEINRFSSHQSSPTVDTKLDDSEKLHHISDLLDNSVKSHMISDVPVGIFLSGGIDSSLIAAKAVKLSNQKIKTFTIGFEDLSQDESNHARKIARHLGSDHFEFFVTAKDAIEGLSAYHSIYDEPFADSSGIPTMLVSKLAAEQVKVVLSGEGADELFLGYGSYKWAKRLTNPLVWNSRNFLSALLEQIPVSRFRRAAKMLDVEKRRLLPSHIFSQEQYYFSNLEIRNLLSEERFDRNYYDPALNFCNSRLKHVIGDRKINSVAEQSLFDLLFYLPDDLLVKVDRASMKYSLETRVPYLDNNLCKYMSQLPSEFKTRHGHKYILKTFLKNYYPAEFFDRPKKGFSVPMKNWLRKDLRHLIHDYLNEKTCEETGLFNYNFINQLIKRFDSGDDYLSQRLWLLLNLNIWLSKNSC